MEAACRPTKVKRGEGLERDCRTGVAIAKEIFAMSNIDGRKAGGGRPPFTAAVFICLLILLGMFAWRVQDGPGREAQPTVSAKP
jgi:hypothetical protein